MIPLGSVPFGIIFKKNSTKGDRPQWYHFLEKEIWQIML